MKAIDDKPSSVLLEVLSETQASGWTRVEPGFFYHDLFGGVVRYGGYIDARGSWVGGHYMLYPPAVGMKVDITRPYGGPYMTAKMGMKAAEAAFEGSDWQRIVMGRGADLPALPPGTYTEFRELPRAMEFDDDYWEDDNDDDGTEEGWDETPSVRMHPYDEIS